MQAERLLNALNSLPPVVRQAMFYVGLSLGVSAALPLATNVLLTLKLDHIITATWTVVFLPTYIFLWVPVTITPVIVLCCFPQSATKCSRAIFSTVLVAAMVFCLWDPLYLFVSWMDGEDVPGSSISAWMQIFAYSIVIQSILQNAQNAGNLSQLSVSSMLYGFGLLLVSDEFANKMDGRIPATWMEVLMPFFKWRFLGLGLDLVIIFSIGVYIWMQRSEVRAIVWTVLMSFSTLLVTVIFIFPVQAARYADGDISEGLLVSIFIMWLPLVIFMTAVLLVCYSRIPNFAPHTVMQQAQEEFSRASSFREGQAEEQQDEAQVLLTDEPPGLVV